MAEANADITNRLITKVGTGIATVPPSADHRNGDWVETDIYDGELYMNLTDGKLYTSNSGVVQEIGASSPDTNLGNTNLTADANRTYTLNGSLSSDTLAFKTGGGSDVLSVRGDNSLYIPTGHIGHNSLPSANSQFKITGDGSIYGMSMSGTNSVAGYQSQGLGGNTPIQFYASKIVNTGFRADGNAIGTATRYGFDASIINTNSVDNVCFRANAVNAGAGNATAIHIVAGDVKLPTGAIGFTGTGTYTTLTIEKGIITNAV